MRRVHLYFIGAVVGLSLGALGGRAASRVNTLVDFNRFWTVIQPQDSFFPTISQLVNTAKTRASPDQTLILVGSNSIFRGTGQGPDDLWTIDLQRRLGDQYVVLNYAIDQASMTAFAGVVYRSLRPFYAKIKFVSMADLRGASPIDGDEPYKYLFWDAYYKSRLSLSSLEFEAVRSRQMAALTDAGNFSLQAMGALDSVLYFNDLWNYIGYKFFFSLWVSHTAASPFDARASIKEPQGPNWTEIRIAQAADRGAVSASVNRMSAMIDALKDVPKTPSNPVAQSYERTFTAEQRSDVILVIQSNNPKYDAELPSRQQVALHDMEDWLASELKRLKYNVVEVGADWVTEDYVDIAHLTKSGGLKLSQSVAEAIRNLPQQR